MKKLPIIFLFIVLTSCENNASKTDFGDCFYDKTDSFLEEQFKYDEYVCKDTNEIIRLFDCGKITFVNNDGVFSSNYSIGGDYLTFEHCFKNDENVFINDQFCLRKKDGYLQQIEKYSFSKSGFSFANKTFYYSKTVNENAKYLYTIDDLNKISIFISFLNVSNVVDYQSFEEEYNLCDFSPFKIDFYTLNDNKNVAASYLFEANQFETVMNSFIKLSKNKNCLDFSYSFLNSCKQYFNLEHYDLNSENRFNDYISETLDVPLVFNDGLLNVGDYSEFHTLIEEQTQLENTVKEQLLVSYDNSFFDSNYLIIFNASNVLLGNLNVYCEDDNLYVSLIEIYPDSIKDNKIITQVLPRYFFLSVEEMKTQIISISKTHIVNDVILIDGTI